MLESEPTTADEIRSVITDALAAGVLTRNEILDMVSTIDPPAANCNHAPAEPTAGADELPIYTELPEGLIDLPSAAAGYGCTVQRFRGWIRKGYIKPQGRLRAGCPGGGYLVVSREDL